MKMLKEVFKKNGLEKKNFQDPRYRMIQYLITNGQTKDEKIR